MKKIQKETLLTITEQFPTFTWKDAEIQELITPQLGVITAFSEILDQIETIMRLDLAETGFCAPQNSLENTHVE